MRKDEMWFIPVKLPKPLTREQVLNCVEQYQQGDQEARDRLILHNVKLVISIVDQKFRSFSLDKQDLVSIGIFGLIKGVETYDPVQKVPFTNYVAICIRNEIITYLRKIKQQDRFDPFLYIEEKEPVMSIEEQYEEKEAYHQVRTLVELLPETEQDLVKSYFGFYDRVYSQTELAGKHHITQSCVSKQLKKVIKKLESEMNTPIKK